MSVKTRTIRTAVSKIRPGDYIVPCEYKGVVGGVVDYIVNTRYLEVLEICMFEIWYKGATPSAELNIGGDTILEIERQYN